MNDRRAPFGLLIGLLTAAAGLLRGVGLRSQLPTGDDYLVPLTADFYVSSGQPYPTMPFHPVLRNLLTDLSMDVFGRGAFGVKFFSVVLGTLLVLVTALLVRRVASSDRAGLIAGLLVAMDVLLIDYSRQAVQEIHVAFFSVLGAWLVAESFSMLDTRRWYWILPAAGAAFGLGIASKMYAVMPLLVSVAVVLRSAAARKRADEMLTVVTSLILLPATVFLLTYAPWFGRGYDFSEWLGFMGATLEAMVTHTRPLVGFLANSRPILWFVVPFYAFADYVRTPEGTQLAVGLGNPLVWLAVLPATAYAVAKRSLRSKAWFLLLLFAFSYLPLAFSPRPIWMLSAVSVAPFALAIVATALDHWWSDRSDRVAVTYVLAVVLTSALLFPLAIGRAEGPAYLRPIVDGLGIDEVEAITSAGRR